MPNNFKLTRRQGNCLLELDQLPSNKRLSPAGRKLMTLRALEQFGLASSEGTAFAVSYCITDAGRKAARQVHDALRNRGSIFDRLTNRGQVAIKL